jgi:hypothetical protein
MLMTRVYRGVTDIEDSGTEKKIQMDCLDKKKGERENDDFGSKFNGCWSM